MADLLECLIQIRALGETLEWTARLAGGTDDSARWKRLADAERRCATALGTGAGVSPDADEVREGTAARQVFLVWRRANLDMLDRCTAAQLAGPVEWPGRRGTTVADLVAMMLASDTELLGDLRRARSRREGGGSTVESGTPTPESCRQAPRP